MPVVTPFGEITLGDKVSLSRWAAAHAAKHTQLVAENIGPKGGSLDEPIDADWMHRHAARHVALATATAAMPGVGVNPSNKLPPLSSADTKVLAAPGLWQNEQQLQDWHDLHNRHHAVIDAQRAIATTQAKPNQAVGGVPPTANFPTRPGAPGGPPHPSLPRPPQP